MDWNLKWKTANAHQTDAGMFASIPFIHNHRTEPHISDQIILNTRISSKRVAKYWRVVLWNMWQIALQNEMFRGSLLNTVPLRITHTWRAMTYRAGAASPPSQPSLRRPGGFCRSSLICRRPPCLLRSPCSPWSNRARVNLQRITQIGSARSAQEL